MNFCAPYMSWLKPLSTLCICGLVFTWGDGTNKKKLIKIYAEKIPRIHAFSPPELKRLFVIDKKKGGGLPSRYDPIPPLAAPPKCPLASTD